MERKWFRNPVLFPFLIFNYILFTCFFTCMHACHGLYVEVRDQLMGIVSLLPPCTLRVKPRSSALLAGMFTCSVISSVLFFSHFFYEKLDYVSKAKAKGKWKKKRSGRLPSGDGDAEGNCRLLEQIPFLLLCIRQKILLDLTSVITTGFLSMLGEKYTSYGFPLHLLFVYITLFHPNIEFSLLHLFPVSYNQWIVTDICEVSPPVKTSRLATLFSLLKST